MQIVSLAINMFSRHGSASNDSTAENSMISLFEEIELLNNKSHGLLPPGGFSFLSFDQAVPYFSQRHLIADRNAIYILH